MLLNDLDETPCISHANDQQKVDCIMGSIHELIKKDIDANNDLIREQAMPTCCSIWLYRKTKHTNKLIDVRSLCRQIISTNNQMIN